MYHTGQQNGASSSMHCDNNYLLEVIISCYKENSILDVTWFLDPPTFNKKFCMKNGYFQYLDCTKMKDFLVLAEMYVYEVQSIYNLHKHLHTG